MSEFDFSRPPSFDSELASKRRRFSASSKNRSDHRKLSSESAGSGSSSTSSTSSGDNSAGNQRHLISSSSTIPTAPADTTSNSNLSLTKRSSSSSSMSSTKKLSNWQKNILYTTLVIALFVIIALVSLYTLLPSIVSNKISKMLVLKNGSLFLERWSKPDIPMYFKVYVFDVKNAQEVIDKRGTKPQLREIGPFVFHLKRQKDIVSFAGDNLYYTERKIYHFSPELSCCAINTTVTIPNIPLVAVVDRALSYNLPLVGRFIPRLINRAIQSLREQLFVKKQVREILFDGYEVELLKMVSRVGSLVGLPQTQQKFALLKGRNDTWRPEQDGVWAINTGVRDRKMFGKVSSWNSYRQLPFWAQQACNTINGSDGTLFPPPIKRSEPLYIFNQELCRTVNLVFDRPSDIRAIKAYRFVLNPMNFAHTMKAGTPLVPSQSQPALRTTPAISFRPPLAPPPAPLASLAAIQQSPRGPANNQNSLKPAASEGRPVTSGAPPVDANAALLPQNKRQWLVANNQNNQMSSMSSRPNNNNNNQAQQQRPAAVDLSQPASPAEQQRLVKVAQEQQAQIDRQSASRQNPFTCFCDRKTTNLNGVNVCEFDGLIELSKCTKQAQVIFGSMPHFYQSDPRLLRQVNGLEPNASRHTTYLDIEPVSIA